MSQCREKGFGWVPSSRAGSGSGPGTVWGGVGVGVNGGEIRVSRGLSGHARLPEVVS